MRRFESTMYFYALKKLSTILIILTGYLHQLGSILHFKEDKDLMNTIFLSPEWVVEGVYTALKSELIKGKGGKFTKTDIFNILKSKGYKEREAQKILRDLAQDGHLRD